MRIANNKNRFLIMISLSLVIVGGYLAYSSIVLGPSYGGTFNGDRAFEDLAYQVSLGPRPTGSQAHEQTIGFIRTSLEDAGWEVSIQETTEEGQPIKNIIAQRGGEGEWIILGAHYDTRLFADQDPDPSKTSEPVIGANDGASGVAVLLELARVLPRDLDKKVWLVFFDAEDNGNIEGWDWVLGSRAFVRLLEEYPDAVVVVDMVGDTDLNLFYERNSTSYLSEEIWQAAAELGYPAFIPSGKFSMLDDHTAFLNAGIPAVDIIDFDYPYWHTTEDTIDKVSPESLQVVGETLQTWLLEE